MKEQSKNLENKLKKIEKSDLPDAEFKTLVIKMLKDLSENFHKKIGNIKMEIKKKNWSEMKNTITETKYTLERINNRLD